MHMHLHFAPLYQMCSHADAGTLLASLPRMPRLHPVGWARGREWRWAQRFTTAEDRAHTAVDTRTCDVLLIYGLHCVVDMIFTSIHVSIAGGKKRVQSSFSDHTGITMDVQLISWFFRILLLGCYLPCCMKKWCILCSFVWRQLLLALDEVLESRWQLVCSLDLTRVAPREPHNSWFQQPVHNNTRSDQATRTSHGILLGSSFWSASSYNSKYWFLHFF